VEGCGIVFVEGDVVGFVAGGEGEGAVFDAGDGKFN
jgi:hypothetical protein